MTRYPYTTIGRFPAPFVHVNVRQVDGSVELTNLPAQLDTGADRTVVPWTVVQGLNLVQVDEIDLQTLDGRIVKLETYLVHIAIRQQLSQTVEVAASKGEPWILLGRDVLNNHRILLDGLQQILEIG